MLIRVLKIESNKNRDEYGRDEYNEAPFEPGSIVVLIVAIFKQLDEEIYGIMGTKDSMFFLFSKV